MELTQNELRWFYRQVQRIIAEVDELKEAASTSNLDFVSSQYGFLVSFWDNLNEHADRVGIPLSDYKDDFNNITVNLKNVEITLRKRESNPKLYEFLRPVMVVAEKIDNVLKVLKIPPLLKPIGEAILGFFGLAMGILAPPKIPLSYLPSGLANSAARSTSPETSTSPGFPPFSGFFPMKQPVVSIENVRVEQNVIQNGQSGIRILSEIRVDNLKDSTIEIGVYFQFVDGTALRAFNPEYSTPSGELKVSQKEVLPYENTLFRNYSLFIPRRALTLPAWNKKCRFCIEVFNRSASEQISWTCYKEIVII